MTKELICGLRVLLASEEDCGDAVRVIADALKEAGAEAEVEENDGSPDALNDDDTLWVVSDHKLVIDGETVAEWTRCTMGTWGEQSRQCSDDEWCLSEDTNGGDRLPELVAVALGVFGLEDDIPDVPEPDKATDTYEEDEDGEYAVYWETVLDDAHVVARYATEEAAEAVCAQKRREFSARKPSDSSTAYLCGFGVRQLVDGKWVRR